LAGERLAEGIHQFINWIPVALADSHGFMRNAQRASRGARRLSFIRRIFWSAHRERFDVGIELGESPTDQSRIDTSGKQRGNRHIGDQPQHLRTRAGSAR